MQWNFIPQRLHHNVLNLNKYPHNTNTIGLYSLHSQAATILNCNGQVLPFMLIKESIYYQDTLKSDRL